MTLRQRLIPEWIGRHRRWLAESRRRPGCEIDRSCEISSDSVLEPPVRIYPGARLVSATVGAYSYVGIDSHLAMATIGRFCSLAPCVVVGGGVHPASGWVSTNPTFYSTRRQTGASFVENDRFDELPATRIGHDVWMGFGAILLPGRQIADGAIVGAGAVVTRDLPAYAVAVGNPAVVKRYRFDEADREWLQALAWWNWSESRLRAAAESFRSVPELRRFVESEAIGGGSR